MKRFTERIDGLPRDSQALLKGKVRIPKWAVERDWRTNHPEQAAFMTGESSDDEEEILGDEDRDAEEKGQLEDNNTGSSSSSGSCSSDSDSDKGAEL